MPRPYQLTVNRLSLLQEICPNCREGTELRVPRLELFGGTPISPLDEPDAHVYLGCSSGCSSSGGLLLRGFLYRHPSLNKVLFLLEHHVLVIQSCCHSGQRDRSLPLSHKNCCLLFFVFNCSLRVPGQCRKEYYFTNPRMCLAFCM